MNDKTAVKALVPRLPYPLAYNLSRLLVEAAEREQGKSVPLFAYSICALNGLILRLAATVGIQSYVRIAGARDAAINQKVIAALRQPADGTWREITGLTLNAVADRTDTPLAARFREALAKKRAKFGAKTVAAGLEALVGFRNRLVHDRGITDAETNSMLDLVLNIVLALDFLAEYDLLLRQADKGFRLAGAKAEPMAEIQATLPEGEPCLVRRDGSEPPLSLSPLLVFREGTPNGTVEFDELFFLNAGAIERLSYIAFQYTQQMDGRQLGSYDAFRKFVQQIPAPPTPPEPRIDFKSFATDHTRLFVGREDVLEEIARFVETRPAPYGVVTALAGMGKTAVFARLLETCGNSPHRWVFHFCMPSDGRDSPVVALRSLIAQVCDACAINRKDYLSNDIDELKEKFVELLNEAAAQLPAGKRIVVAIDALDEGISGGSQESVPSVLPDEVPENVVFLVSYRVDQTHRNTRVESQLTDVPHEARHPITGANPLAGLTRDNVVAFLAHLAEGATVPELTAESVWNAASKDGHGADPFFLRFVADGVEAGRMDVARAETIPESLDEAFDELWMSLPTDRDFLLHRILGMLAIMRDYGDDDMFAYLFGKDLPRDALPLTASEVASLRVKAGKLLVYDNDRYGLFHDRFRRYLVGDQPDPLERAPGRQPS